MFTIMLNVDAVASLDNLPLRWSSQCAYRGGSTDVERRRIQLPSRTVFLQTSNRLSDVKSKQMSLQEDHACECT